MCACAVAKLQGINKHSFHVGCVGGFEHVVLTVTWRATDKKAINILLVYKTT